MKQNWVREMEHGALRVVSVIFSAASAHAILWFYSSMDKVQGADFIQPFIPWGLAVGFTAFGYFASRGLAHRLLNKERIRVYFLICLVLMLVEFSANFAQAAVSISHIDWLRLFHGAFYNVLLVMVYLVMPIVPIVTIVLAWVDMDMEMGKEGYRPGGLPFQNMAGKKPPVAVPLNAAFPPRAGATPQQPRMTAMPSFPVRPGQGNGQAPAPGMAPLMSYPAGYPSQQGPQAAPPTVVFSNNGAVPGR